jgi:hypothetical protein
MRITQLTVGFAAVLGLTGLAPVNVTASVAMLDAPLITSDNVTYHGTIPLDSPGVGGEVVDRPDLDDRRFFYATGLKGLSIYDVTTPTLPVPVGFLPFPHSQNEDLKVSDDGTRAVIAADGSLLLPIAPATTGIHIIDTTDPSSPQLIGSSNPTLNGTGVGTGISEHTAECATADCSVIYGRTGRIYEFDEETGVVAEVGFWNLDLDGNSVGGIHALNRDATGLIISDSNPRLILDPVGLFDPDATPTNPTVLAQGTRSDADNRLQHNNVRTDAEAWTSRSGSTDSTAGPGNAQGKGKGLDRARSKAPERDEEGDAGEVETAVEGVDFEVHPRSISVASERPVMRPGEMFLGNSETNLNPTCNAAGGLSTWSMVNFDRDDVTTIQQLEVFRPLNGTYLDGSPAVNALGCSGHWFTENDGIVAASWYEHGVHFFEVDKTVGTIVEVGYFQPGVAESGAAYWVDDNVVYSVDYGRGIDIISFDRSEDLRPSQAELDQAWIANLYRVGTMSSNERFVCNLAITD